MLPVDSQDVTLLLKSWSGGNREALDELFSLVYQELRMIARRRMSEERAGHTLQPTALVHEAFGRMAKMDVTWNDRVHFFGFGIPQRK